MHLRKCWGKTGHFSVEQNATQVKPSFRGMSHFILPVCASSESASASHGHGEICGNFPDRNFRVGNCVYSCWRGSSGRFAVRCVFSLRGDSEASPGAAGALMQCPSAIRKASCQSKCLPPPQQYLFIHQIFHNFNLFNMRQQIWLDCKDCTVMY